MSFIIQLQLSQQLSKVRNVYAKVSLATIGSKNRWSSNTIVCRHANILKKVYEAPQQRQNRCYHSIDIANARTILFSHVLTTPQFIKYQNKENNIYSYIGAIFDYFKSTLYGTMKPRIQQAVGTTSPLCSDKVTSQKSVSGESLQSILSNEEDILNSIVVYIKRTFQPSIIRKKRKTGFLVRQRTVGGRKTLARRRAKGRARLGGGI